MVFKDIKEGILLMFDLSIYKGLCWEHGVFRELICLQHETPPNTAKNAQSYVVVQTMSKQNQTHNSWIQGAFDTNKYFVANVMCLDRRGITPKHSGTPKPVKRDTLMP